MLMKVERRRGPIDIYIGARIRSRREQIGMSQERLAVALGTSHQQVQHYEKGRTRFAAAQLLPAAELLEVPVTYFFEGAPGYQNAPEVPDPVRELAGSRDGIKVIEAINGIRSKPRRDLLMGFVQILQRDEARGE